MKISIHAPTRGATINLIICRLIILFQSTLPREERRLCHLIILRCNLHFNPRSHERSDRFIKFFFSVFQNFNPRSHERSDQFRARKQSQKRNFNPRSHERSDSNIAQKICLFLYNTDNKYIIR